MKWTIAILFAALLSVSVVSTGCSVLDTNDLTSDEEERRDELVGLAKSAYDDAARADNPLQQYMTAYTYAQRALEIDPDDLGAQVIVGWSLLQMGYYSDYKEQGTEIDRDGARTVFNTILDQSPNEFRARQGIAVISFREHFLFADRADHFDSARRELVEIRAQGSAYFDAQAEGSGKASLLYDEIKERWERFVAQYERLWGRYGIEFYRQEYADVARMRSLLDDERKTYLIGAGGDATRAKELASSFELRALLPSVNTGLDIFDRAMFAEGVDELIARCEMRRNYWDQLTSARIESARSRFVDLLRTAPQYFWARRDLGLVYMAKGSIALEKALEEMKREGKLDEIDELGTPSQWDWRKRATITWQQLPASHASAVRAAFGSALDELVTFVEEEEEELRSKEQTVGEVEQQLLAGDNANPVTQGWFDIYVDEVEGIYSERKTYRKFIILQIIDLLSNNTYGVRDENKALTWVSELEDTDTNDPLHHFVRGVLYHKFAVRAMDDTKGMQALLPTGRKVRTEDGALVDEMEANPEYLDLAELAEEYFGLAKGEFAAYEQRASFVQDENRLKVAREREQEIDFMLSRLQDRLREVKNAPKARG